MAVIEAGLDTLYYRRCLEEQQQANKAVLGASRGEDDGQRGRIRGAGRVGLTLGAPLLFSACLPSPAPIASPAPSPERPDLQPVPASPESGRIGQETDCPPESFCMTVLSPQPKTGEAAVPLPILVALTEVREEIGLLERVVFVEARGSRKEQIGFYFLETDGASLVALPAERQGEYVISFYQTEMNGERTVVVWQAIVGQERREFMRFVFDSPLSSLRKGEALANYQNRLKREIMDRLKNKGVIRLTLTNPYTAQTVTLPPLGKKLPYFAS